MKLLIVLLGTNYLICRNCHESVENFIVFQPVSQWLWPTPVVSQPFNQIQQKSLVEQRLSRTPGHGWQLCGQAALLATISSAVDR